MSLGLERITKKIMLEANEYAENTLAEARAEAKKISDEYAAQAEKENYDIVNAAYEKSREIVNRSSAQGAKELRINLLSAKWEYLDKSFSEAQKLLCEMPDNKKINFISGLIEKYQSRDAELIFNKAEKERIGEAVVNAANSSSRGLKVTLSEKTGDFSGGIILKEGDIESNLTYETLISLRREGLEEEVSAMLFEQ